MQAGNTGGKTLQQCINQLDLPPGGVHTLRAEEFGFAARAGQPAGRRWGISIMKKYLGLLASVVAALGAICQSAEAQPRRAPPEAVPDVYIGPFRIGDPDVSLVGMGVGLAMTGAYIAIEDKRSLRFAGETGKNFNGGAFALTTIGCMALSPMIASIVVYNTQGRNLTHREAMGMGADCIVPFLGSLIVNAAFDAHPEWPR
jgi:hypothetical protein